MSEFQELIKNFDKCRDYIRDFFVYGFKSRNDFTGKSARTYDDERRRITDWLGDIVREDISDATSEKNLSLQVTPNLLDTNPLYRVWQTRSFTDNDARLFFRLPGMLTEPHTVDELTDELSRRYGIICDSQIVRRKCKELEEEGLLHQIKEGKTIYYKRNKTLDEMLAELSDVCELEDDPERLYEAIEFFQLWYPFGFAGYSIMEIEDLTNSIFRVKHSFPEFCLEDEILYQILEGIRLGFRMTFTFSSNLRGENSNHTTGVPVRILVSYRTGRRYVVLYDSGEKRRFSVLRLDQIKNVKKDVNADPGKYVDADPGKDRGSGPRDAEKIREMLDRNLGYVWNASFSAGSSEKRAGYRQKVEMTIHINERTESYILSRIRKEGKRGTLTKLSDDTYLYENVVFDVNEMFPWLRTFIGRIEDIRFYSLNSELEKTRELTRIRDMFFGDIERLYDMYEID